MPLDLITQREAIAHVIDRKRHGGWIITPNLDQLRQYVETPEVRPLYEEASLVLCDGAGLALAARAQGTPVPERIAGSTMIWSLVEAAASAEMRVFLLGGDPGVAEQAAVVLREQAVGVQIVGTFCPPRGFEDDSAAMAEIREALLEAAPDLVFTALPFPKGEFLTRLLRPDLAQTWFMGVGISLSFVAGEVARAPSWMQRAGVEWVHRLSQEPRRLFRRYVIDGIPFAARVLPRLAWRRFRRKLEASPS